MEAPLGCEELVRSMELLMARDFVEDLFAFVSVVNRKRYLPKREQIWLFRDRLWWQGHPMGQEAAEDLYNQLLRALTKERVRKVLEEVLWKE